MSTSPAIPAGAKRIGPGIYSHQGEMHIDASEMLDAVGAEPTPENMERLSAIAAQVSAEHGIPFDQHEVDR